MSLTQEDKVYIQTQMREAVEEIVEVIRDHMNQIDARFKNSEHDIKLLRRDSERNWAKWKKIAEAAQS